MSQKSAKYLDVKILRATSWVSVGFLNLHRFFLVKMSSSSPSYSSTPLSSSSFPSTQLPKEIADTTAPTNVEDMEDKASLYRDAHVLWMCGVRLAELAAQVPPEN